jgi:hypothetical protein
MTNIWPDWFYSAPTGMVNTMTPTDYNLLALALLAVACCAVALWRA